MEKSPEKVLEELTRSIEVLTERARDASQKVESIARERPMIALGAAFILGLLLGVIIGASSRRRD